MTGNLNPLWDNDLIQFARLLAEITATQDNLDMTALAESMDLKIADVKELFERAQADWNLAKGLASIELGKQEGAYGFEDERGYFWEAPDDGGRIRVVDYDGNLAMWLDPGEDGYDEALAQFNTKSGEE